MSKIEVVRDFLRAFPKRQVGAGRHHKNMTSGYISGFPQTSGNATGYEPVFVASFCPGLWGGIFEALGEFQGTSCLTKQTGLHNGINSRVCSRNISYHRRNQNRQILRDFSSQQGCCCSGACVAEVLSQANCRNYSRDRFHENCDLRSRLRAPRNGNIPPRLWNCYI